MAHRGISSLSNREREVLLLVYKGWSSKQIARELGLSFRTVDGVIQSAMMKLGVTRRQEAAFAVGEDQQRTNEQTEASTPPGQAISNLTPAPTSVQSSSWTGKRSSRQQILLVRAMLPPLAESLDQVINAVSNVRLNDQNILDDLRALHQALGELIETSLDQNGFRRKMTHAKKQFLAVADRGDELIRAVWKSPTKTIGVLSAVGFVLGVPQEAFWGGIAAEFIKNAK